MITEALVHMFATIGVLSTIWAFCRIFKDYLADRRAVREIREGEALVKERLDRFANRWAGENEEG